MSDPFLEREKELMKLNESLNTKMTFDLKQPKAIVSNRTKRVTATATIAAATTKSFKYDQINHAKLCTKGTSKLKTDTCEIIKKPISNGHTATAEKFTIVEKSTELDAKDIGFNRNSSSSSSSGSNSGNNRNRSCHSKANETITISMGGDGNNKDDDCDNTHQINGENIDHALIETIEKAIDTKVDSGQTMTANNFNLIPSNVTRKNITTDGIIKFLKAKVTILQQELELSHQENAKNLDNLAKVHELHKKTESSRCHASNTINTLNAQIQKQQQNDTANAIKLKEYEMMYQSQRKECDDLKSKLKLAHQANATLEMRLNKSLDDLECLRKNYRTAKSGEKDLQLTLQNERTFYENQLKINQKQRNDLIVALKKHMLLIGNLKQQNACLAQAKCIQLSEMEFMKILDWNQSNNTNANAATATK